MGLVGEVRFLTGRTIYSQIGDVIGISWSIALDRLLAARLLARRTPVDLDDLVNGATTT